MEGRSRVAALFFEPSRWQIVMEKYFSENCSSKSSLYIGLQLYL
jgi:hypothetical protein